MEVKRGSELLIEGANRGGDSLSSARPAAAYTLAGQAGQLYAGIVKQLEFDCSLRVAAAQMKPLATRFKDNLASMKSYIDRAIENGVDLVVFPEECIPGYMSLDLSFDKDYVDENLKALEEILSYCKGKEITVIAGFIDWEKDTVEGEEILSFHNSAAIIQNGELKKIYDKKAPATFDVFDDHRNIKPGDSNLIIDVKGKRVGVTICQDIWEKKSPTVCDELVAEGAELIVNLSASPFHAGKYQVRQELLEWLSLKHKVPFLYCNMVGVQDGYEGELVFDGRSLIYGADGKALGIGKAFEEDLLIADLNTPKQAVLPEWAPVSEVYHAVVFGIREYFARNGFKRAYIGLSGGIDSEVVSALAVDALGPENVIGVTMPMKNITSGETLNDAIRGAALKGIRCDIRPIGEMYDAWFKGASEKHEKFERLTKQNKQPQMRGAILTEYTHQDRAGLIISTGNKTEAALGYMTLYGDMCGGLAAILDVSKLMVYELADFINNIHEREVIPFSTIKRVPSAELEPGQADKTDLPADYPVLSPLVEDLVSKEKTRIQLYKEYGQDVVDRTAKMIARAEYKRRQAPSAIRVTSKAFGVGRRIPLDSTFF